MDSITRCTRMRGTILFCFLLYTATSFAQNHSEKLDSLFNSLYSHGQMNGNVLVAEHGQPVYKKSFGYLNIATQTLHDENSLFSLASISKSITATAILQLKEKGTLKLDDYVTTYLNEFPYPNITIRNLLTHTSGLPDFDLFEDEIKRNPNKIFTNKDVLPSLKVWNKPLENKPNETWTYSNINYLLLALIIEEISGEEFQAYVRKHIFIPAKMKNTIFQTDSLVLRNKRKSTNYTYPFKYSSKLKRVDSIDRFHWNVHCLSGFVGQGNILSTTEDMLKFDQILYSGTLLKNATLAEAFAPNKLIDGTIAGSINFGQKYYQGLGWFVLEDTTEGHIVWHSGGVPGALSILFRNIDKRQTVIVLDNTFSSGLYRNGLNAMNILNNKPLVATKQSLARVYGSTLVEKGPDEAYAKLIEMRDDTTYYYVSEEDLNDLGYQFLYEASFDNHDRHALEVLKQNTLLFPNSFNTYDSYGEALAKSGKKEEAIVMYRKSIALNPANEGGKKALEELLRKQGDQK